VVDTFRRRQRPDGGAATEARAAKRPAQRKAAEKRARKAEAAARAPLREAVARLEARPPSYCHRARSAGRRQNMEEQKKDDGNQS